MNVFVGTPLDPKLVMGKLTIKSDCRICGERVPDLEDHMKKHARAAEGDEDCRGGAPRP